MSIRLAVVAAVDEHCEGEHKERGRGSRNVWTSRVSSPMNRDFALFRVSVVSNIRGCRACRRHRSAETLSRIGIFFRERARASWTFSHARSLLGRVVFLKYLVRRHGFRETRGALLKEENQLQAEFLLLFLLVRLDCVRDSLARKEFTSRRLFLLRSVRSGFIVR